MNKKELLLNAIEELLRGNINKVNAICENLDSITGQYWLGSGAVEYFSTTWEYFSGNVCYPVSGRVAWTKVYYNNRSFWDGEQGELRMSLLEHIKSEVLKLSDEAVEEVFQ